MADKYLMKVGIDFDQAQLDAVTGKISDQLSSMGKLSEEFIDNALATAKKYNEEIDKQRKIIAEIDAKLNKGNVDPATKQLLEQTKAKSQKILDSYMYGDKEKGLESKAVVDAMANYASQAEGFAGKLNRAGGVAVQGLAKFGAGVNAAMMIIQQFTGKVGEALDKFAKFSNKLNPLGAFGDQGQRDIMTRYGMTGTQAMGFQNTLSAMGMSEQDIGRMTPEQQKVFNSLQNFWNEGMGKLDPDALDRYTKSMQQYQEIQAKFQMGIQMTIMKLITNSPKFSQFVGRVGDLLDSVLDFFNSPVVQAVFDGLIDFLTTVVSLLDKAMRAISKIPGFGGGGNQPINNTTNNNVNSNFNIYGSDFQSNDELARQISYSTRGNYGG